MGRTFIIDCSQTLITQLTKYPICFSCSWKSYILFRSVHLVYSIKSIALYRLIAKQQKTCAAQICSVALGHAPQKCRMGSFGFSKAHPVVVTIEDCVVLADENVSQNPQGPGRWRDVQSHEATQTNSLPSLTLLIGRQR